MTDAPPMPAIRRFLRIVQIAEIIFLAAHVSWERKFDLLYSDEMIDALRATGERFDFAEAGPIRTDAAYAQAAAAALIDGLNARARQLRERYGIDE